MIRKTQITKGQLINLDKEANNETYLLGLALQLSNANPLTDPAAFFEELASKDYVGKVLMLEKHFGKQIIMETENSEILKKVYLAQKAEREAKKTAMAIKEKVEKKMPALTKTIKK